MIQDEIRSATYADNHLSEEDIKNQFIQPAMEDKGWDKQHMRLEYYYTAGRIIVQGSMKHRKKGKKCDYVLYTEDNYPIAVVEAKDHNHLPAHGLQQAIDYATDLKLPFAYSSNGEQFVEHDMLTGTERTFGMDRFPTPLELKERYYTWLHQNKNLTDEGEKLLDIPYYSDSDSFPPRYYQRIAINSTIQAVACGQKRILLVMAPASYSTASTWFYRMDMPEGYKHFSKIRPILNQHFEVVDEWWNNRQLLEEGEKSRSFTPQELMETGCNFDQCKFPKEEKEVLRPEELLKKYHEERSALDAKIDETLSEIQQILGIKI